MSRTKDRQIINLTDLEIGEWCVALNIIAEESMRRRLQDIGVIKGTKIKCVLISPHGDPMAFLIRGAVIALRCEDSACIHIEKLFKDT